MRIAHTSDTHWTWQEDEGTPLLQPIPECDVLVHSGDATFRGESNELQWLRRWFEQQPAKHKIFVPGNHELSFEEDPEWAYAYLEDVCTILINEETEIEGVRFYGTPYQPIFFSWAFNRDEKQLDEIYAMIPEGVDVLITHAPAFGHLDKVGDVTKAGSRAGSFALAKHIARVQPIWHLFGHIHGSYGIAQQGWPSGRSTTFVNSAMCDEDYSPVNKPQVFDITRIA